MSHPNPASYLVTTSQDRVENEWVCPACGKGFRTIQGRNAHLSSSCQCAWYNKEKNDNLVIHYEDEDLAEDLPNSQCGDELPPQSDASDQFGYEGYDSDQDQYNVVPIASPHDACLENLPSDASHTPKCAQLDDSSIVHDRHPFAGKIIGHRPTALQFWAAESNNPNSNRANAFDPFESELDWQTAKWFVEDGPSKSALDRLLQVEGAIP